MDGQGESNKTGGSRPNNVFVPYACNCMDLQPPVLLEPVANYPSLCVKSDKGDPNLELGEIKPMERQAPTAPGHGGTLVSVDLNSPAYLSIFDQITTLFVQQELSKPPKAQDVHLTARNRLGEKVFLIQGCTSFHCNGCFFCDSGLELTLLDASDSELLKFEKLYAMSCCGVESNSILNVYGANQLKIGSVVKKNTSWSEKYQVIGPSGALLLYVRGPKWNSDNNPFIYTIVNCAGQQVGCIKRFFNVPSPFASSTINLDADLEASLKALCVAAMAFIDSINKPI